MRPSPVAGILAGWVLCVSGCGGVPAGEPRTGTLRGTVWLAEGGAAAGAVVAVEGGGPSATVGADGTFRIPRVPIGPCAVIASLARRVPERVAGLDVGPGATRDVPAIVLLAVRPAGPRGWTGRPPARSPDGTRLLFAVHGAGADQLWAWDDRAFDAVEVEASMHDDGDLGRTQFSPGGRWAAFVTRTPGEGISLAVYDFETRRVIPLGRGAVPVRFGPDEDHLIWRSGLGGPGYTLSLAALPDWTVALCPDLQGSEAISSTGDVVACVIGPAGRLVRWDLHTREATVLLRAGARGPLRASADLGRILALSGESGGAYATVQVWTAGAGLSTAAVDARTDRILADPDFTHAFVIADARPGGERRLLRVELGTGETTPIADGVDEFEAPPPSRAQDHLWFFRELAAGAGELGVWDEERRAALPSAAGVAVEGRLAGGPDAVAFLTDAADGRGTVKLHRFADGRALALAEAGQPVAIAGAGAAYLAGLEGSLEYGRLSAIQPGSAWPRFVADRVPGLQPGVPVARFSPAFDRAVFPMEDGPGTPSLAYWTLGHEARSLGHVSAAWTDAELHRALLVEKPGPAWRLAALSLDERRVESIADRVTAWENQEDDVIFGEPCDASCTGHRVVLFDVPTRTRRTLAVLPEPVDHFHGFVSRRVASVSAGAPVAMHLFDLDSGRAVPLGTVADPWAIEVRDDRLLLVDRTAGDHGDLVLVDLATLERRVLDRDVIDGSARTGAAGDAVAYRKGDRELWARALGPDGVPLRFSRGPVTDAFTSAGAVRFEVESGPDEGAWAAPLPR